eukprot:7630865-Prorocentrum_lima.AAC.1
MQHGMWSTTQSKLIMILMRMELFWGEHRGDEAVQVLHARHSEPYKRKREGTVQVATGIVPIATYLAVTLPEM